MASSFLSTLLPPSWRTFLSLSLVLFTSSSSSRSATAFSVRHRSVAAASLLGRTLSDSSNALAARNSCLWKNRRIVSSSVPAAFSTSSLSLLRGGGGDFSDGPFSYSSRKISSKNLQSSSSCSTLKQTATTTEESSTKDVSSSSSSTAYTQILTPEESFIKPDRDSRQYRYIRLPNNLKVLLVSNPGSGSQVEAASIHVQAGHFDDTIPGLAHFHEHMLVGLMH